MKKNFKIIGITFSITFFAFIVLAFFIKALGVLLNPFFENNSLTILIITGILLLIGIITGAIGLGALYSKKKLF